MKTKKNIKWISSSAAWVSSRYVLRKEKKRGRDGKTKGINLNGGKKKVTCPYPIYYAYFLPLSIFTSFSPPFPS